MFDKVGDAEFISGEHQVLRFWKQQHVFAKLRQQIAGGAPWSFIDGPMTANNPMGVHHAWGRTYKDAYHRYHAMNGRDIRYQNGFDCQGLWVEVEVEKQLGLGAKSEIEKYGIDKFVHECKKRVLKYAAIQTEQSIRLGFWMEWDQPAELKKLAASVGTDEPVEFQPPRGPKVTDQAEKIVARLGNPEWGGSYFTFSTENNETIWAFLKKCFSRGKIYRGHDVMPWSGRGGSAYSQMEVADGRKLTVHRAAFVRFKLKDADNEYLLAWTTTPWTLTSNVAAMVNPDLDYVKLRAKKDGALYYFAKDNLEYQRLAREFKEGFGRPEWMWPKSCPKLKTLSQIFKEQGGYEVEGEVKGTDLIGRPYAGPFDDLPVQSQPGGFPEDDSLLDKTGISCHRVIDGGRDFKGSPNVVAGEGTGIVHSAPGCGDIDHQIGLANELVAIAPLGEDGCFLDGFGEFTGKKATDPATVDLIFAKLKENGSLVAVEQYPHIYPHCWRTGDELVFRLVDEWFINMDWRDEIMDVTRQIDWIPKSIQGEERELEWLTNMRDWMISKKRYWGLALPIWRDEESGDFEVIGSLAELKSRALDGGEGWDEFEGHTPHKPWIDKVKIRNPKTGNLMSRVEDVGNPWLDAGIVPFSTLAYNTDQDYWQKWYPADLVSECFPGQFRNWFYALLSMATMMDKSPPFKTLLGYRLVMNEAGKPMHKSDGTAIWFEEAAEQLGVDAMRWLYFAQNPAQDLRFGTRFPDEKVTLQTPDGSTDVTLDGVQTCLVKSGPVDEARRQVLIPLWNSYAFFVNYARLDGFEPTFAPVPIAERPQIDRWILSNLQAVTRDLRAAFDSFDSPEAARVAAAFIDDLSNWYIRRNRRRFWRSSSEPSTKAVLLHGVNGPVSWDQDKLAAYQTLHEVLVTLTKLLAPIVPFLTERMYQNLVAKWPGLGEPASVHLCPYPTANEAVYNAELSGSMAAAQQVVRLGHKLREAANQRVRQPLAELRVAASSAETRGYLTALADVIADELNVKQTTVLSDLSDLVKYTYRANLKTLGPKYGKHLNLLREKLGTVPADLLAPLRSGQEVTITLDGNTFTLAPEDVQVGTEQAAGWSCGDEGGVLAALKTELTVSLVQEGMARDFVRHVQQARKDANLEIEQRIRIGVETADDAVRAMLEDWSITICGETLANSLGTAVAPANAKSVMVGECEASIWIEVVE